MNRSTFQQPLPPNLASNLAVGYNYTDGKYLPQEEWVQALPVGAMSSTATDMAKFMLAHLQNGQSGSTRILQQDTAVEMHRQHFTQDSRACGWTYGFMEMNLNGQHLIWHGGATPVFHSALVLLPEHNIGLFVSYNSQSAGEAAHQALLRSFMDRYFPASKPSRPIPSGDFAARANRFTGIYRGTNHQNETGIEKMLSLGNEFPVTLAAGGSSLQTIGIEMTWPIYKQTSQWVETEPLVFTRMDGEETLIFQEDVRGNIVGFVVGNDPQAVYLKRDFFDTSSFTLPLVGICLLVFIATLVILPVRYLSSSRTRIAEKTVALLPRLGGWLAWIQSGLSLFFVVAFLMMMTDPKILYGAPPTLKPLLLLPLIVAVLIIGMIVITGFAWARQYWGNSGRILFTLFTFVALAFLGWLQYWNLLFAFFKL